MKDEMTAQQLGNLIGITASRVRELTRQGVLVRDGDGGTYVVARNVKSAFAHLRAGAAGRGGKAAAGVAQERAGLLAVQRKRAEFEFEKEREKWMPIAEFDRHLRTYTRWLRDEVRRIPDRLLGVDRAVVIQMKDEIDRILTDIATGDDLPKELKGEDNGAANI